MLGRKKVNKVDAGEKTYLQWFLSHAVYDMFILSVILLNCVALCVEDPKVPDEDQLDWLIALKWFFNTVYVLDVSLMLFAFGPNYYFMDKWHYLDVTVSAVSLLEIAIALFNEVVFALAGLRLPENETLNTVMNTLKIVRVLRPLKAINMLPSLLEFLEACARSLMSVLVNFSFLLFSISSLSIIIQYLVGDSLSYRCYPDDINDPMVYNNQYYIDYGVEYFQSKYNSDFCSDNSTCASGFICKDLGLNFETVSADYSTPFTALISNMAFLTQRGWPNIFWAIAYSTNYYSAGVTLFFCVVVGSLMIVNMFPAILIAALRLQTERSQKLTYVKYYTGNRDSVTELEILVWACKNESTLQKKMLESNIESIPTQLIRYIWKSLYPQSYEDGMKKMSERKKKLELENGPNFITDPSANVGIFPWRPCVPRCRSWDILRQQIIPDDSWFNLSIIGLVVLNIVLLSLDGLDEPAQSIMYYGEIVCTVVFGVELIVKILLLGPVLYVDSAFNLLDAGLVIMGVLKYVADVPTFITNLRIIKLLRLLRLYRVLKLVQNNDNRDFDDYSITIGALSGLVVECADAMVNVGILLMMLLFVFSLVGTVYFVNGDSCYSTGPTIGCGFTPTTSDVDNLAYIYNLENSFGGEYTSRMNFDTFMDAFVTVFNIMLFNNWHNVMVRMILMYKSTWYFWYFLVLIFLCNYFTTSSLISAVTNVMEAHAVATITEESAATKTKIGRLIRIRSKMSMREYVSKWKANTIETEEARKQNKLAGKSQGKTVNRGNVNEVTDAPIQGSWIRDTIKLREEHSFYLFAPPVIKNELESCWRQKVTRGYIRYTCNLVVNSNPFAFLMWIAVMLAVALALTDNNLGDESVTTLSSYFALVMFMAEMMLKMIEGGFNRYFNDFLNVMDFINNVAIVLYIFLGEPILSKFRIVRLVKLPMVMKNISSSHSLNMFLDSMAEAPSSLLNLIIISFCLVYFMAVIGLQTWLDSMGHCSYDAYPGGQGKDESSPDFPLGCNGVYDIPNQFGYFYTSTIEWKSAVENYNNIWESWQSTFRVFILNNFQGIVYTSMDVTGEGLQPEQDAARQSFIFFLILSMLSMTCMVLFLSIIYYHYMMTSLRSGRKYIIGETAALWCCMEDKLLNIETDNTAAWTRMKPAAVKRFKHLVWRFIRGKKYNFVVTCAVVIPFFMLVTTYDSTYANDSMIYWEVGFNCMYVFEYSLRLAIMGQIFYPNGGRIEFAINCALLGYVFYIAAIPDPTQDILVPLFMRIGCIIRCFRLVHTFPQYMTIYRTLMMGLSGVIPTLAYMAVFISIYAVIGNVVLGHIHPKWGDPFLDNKYNFESYLNAFITLLAMGTGNMWSEILEKLEVDQDPWMVFFIEFYATSFTLVMTIVMKSFALMIIAKYLSHSGGSLGLAGQQIRQFRTKWSSTFGLSKTIDIDGLYRLLMELKAPLGVKDVHPKFVLAERFLMKVMMCMPANSGHLNDDDDYNEKAPGNENHKHKAGKRSRHLYSENYLKEHLWDIKDKFTFRQVLIATHKNFVDPPKLSDEIEFEESREQGKTMQRKLGYALGRLAVMGSMAPEEIAENPNKIAYKVLSMVQRVDLPYFRETFLSVMNHRVLSVKALIRSKGFKPYFGWMLSLCRDALVREKRSAELQLEVKKRISTAMQEVGNTRMNKEIAMNYLAAVNQLLASANYTYTRYVNPIWDSNSMQKVQTKSIGKYIRVVKVDYSSNIYAAVGRTIRIFRCTSGNSEVKQNTKLVKMPSVTMEEHVHDIQVFDNARRIFVAAGNEVSVLMLDKSKRGGLHFKKHIKTLKFHTRPVLTLAVMPSGAQVVSAGDDGYICLWAVSTNSLLSSHYAGSSVYCSVIMNTLTRTNLDVSESLLTDVVCCGTKTGQVIILPMPLARKKTKEGLQWDGLVLKASDYPCTSITERWGYLYAGFADGSIKIWALCSNNYDHRLHASPINSLDFVLVDSQVHHNGAISGITFAGEHLFSASHDYSYVSWRSPEDVNAVKPGNFKQEIDKGHVFHESPITSIDANKNIIATSDESGKIIITAPKRSREQLDKLAAEDLTSIVHFSFVDYDFNNAWCSHQNAVVEEEAYLTITNRGVNEVSVRCLLGKHPNFSVELSSVNYNVSTVEVGPFTRSVYMLPPKESAHFRIVFSPTERRLYHCSIDFMIGEKDKTSVHVMGTGTMPQLVVQNKQSLFDFKTVDVGETSMQMIKVTNYSAKTLIACQHDAPVEYLDRENGKKSVFQFRDRCISIVPRTFELEAGASTYLYASFSPTEEYSTFDMPLVYNLAGAEYTVTTLRMRATKRRIEPALKFVDGISGDETKEHSDNEGADREIGNEETASEKEEMILTKALGTSTMSKLVGLSESKLKRLSATIFSKTKYIPKSQPKDLRPLGSTEYLVRSVMLEDMLRQKGWYFREEDDNALLIHRTSGTFIEMPLDAENCGSMDAVDEVEIGFNDGNRDVYYELWYHNLLLERGFAKKEDAVNIVINSNQLSVEAIQGIDGKDEIMLMDATGTLELNLLIFSRGRKPRNPDMEAAVKVTSPSTDSSQIKKFGNLLRNIYITLNKGFRLDYDNKTASWAFLDRINVGGVRRILHYSEDGLVCCEEAFGNYILESGKVSTLGSADYANLNIHVDLRNEEGTVHNLHVVENLRRVANAEEAHRAYLRFRRKHGFEDTADDQEDDHVHKKALDLKLSYDHKVHSHDGVEVIEIGRPTVSEFSAGASRTVSVEAECNRLERSKLVKVNVGHKSIFYTHTAQLMDPRARASGMTSRSLYPHFLSCHHGSIAVHLKIPPTENYMDTAMAVDSVLDKVFLSTHHQPAILPVRTNDATEITNGWYWIMDSGTLKLVSPSTYLESEEGNPNYSEIVLHAHGFDRIRQDGSILRSGNGYITPLSAGSVPSSNDSRFIRNFDCDGRAIPPSHVSSRFKRLWDSRVHDLFKDSVKLGFVRLLEMQQSRLRNSIENETNKLNSRLEEIKDAAKARGTSMTPAELSLSNDIKDAIEDLGLALNLEKTPEKVLLELVRVTTAHEEMKTKRHRHHHTSTNASEEQKVDGEVKTTEGDVEDKEEKNSSMAAESNIPAPVEVKFVNGKVIMPELHKMETKVANILPLSTLLRYVREVTLPGRSHPLSKPECDACFRDLELEYRMGERGGMMITPENFKSWFNEDAIKKELAQVNDKTFFAILMEEAVKSIEGESYSNVELNEEDAEEAEFAEDFKVRKNDSMKRKSYIQRLSTSFNRIGEKKGIYEIDGFDDRGDDVEEKGKPVGGKAKIKRNMFRRFLSSFYKPRAPKLSIHGNRYLGNSGEGSKPDEGVKGEVGFVDHEAVDYEDTTRAAAAVVGAQDKMDGDEFALADEDSEEYSDDDDSDSSDEDSDDDSYNSEYDDDDDDNDDDDDDDDEEEEEEEEEEENSYYSEPDD